MRNIWRNEDDPLRCDNIAAAASEAASVATVASVASNVILEPVLTDPLMLLARRRPTTNFEDMLARQAYVCTASDFASHDCVDMCRVQDLWQSFLRDVRALCSEAFWNVFLPMHTFPGTHLESALQAIKKQFVQAKQDKKMFPSSRRALIDKIGKLRDFWVNVLHTTTVDVAKFKLPSGTKSVEFKFINPVWAWLMAARRQDPLALHWRPVARRHGVPLYGGGIQFGEFFKTACRGLPRQTSVMAVALHWDGTSAHRVSSSPICIGVGNTNTSDSSAQFCIGYMPHVPDETNRQWRDTTASTTVKHYIRQRCARAILSVLEEAATRGVRCRLKNQRNVEIERVLFPRLSSLNFDQPEAQSFFGLQNKKGCSKCRRRKGYSAFRRGTEQNGADVRHLYRWANDEQSPHRKLAREKLARWGFNYRRECCLLTCTRNLLVHIPGRPEVFPCVDFRDRMHGLVIFLHRVIFQTLDLIVKGSRLRRVLDNRLTIVANRGFRVVGRELRKPKSVFTDVDMSASEKASVIFLLPYVLGPFGDAILPEIVMLPLRTAVAQAQLILISVHGRRLYTEQEFSIIMDRGFVTMFGALESIREWDFNARMTQSLNDEEAPPPKRFKREDR